MSSTYLRLAAPLQSWALGRVTGNIVRTQRQPTADGLKGLVAASLGARRGEWPSWLEGLQFTVRSDQPGRLVDEFQTINPRDEDLEYQERIYLLLTGKKMGKSGRFTPDAQHGTSVLRRTYISGAEFLVEAHHPEFGSQLDHALRHPRFTPYLGRKAFAPTFPYYLGTGPRGALDWLPTIKRETNALLRVSDGKTVVVDALPIDEWLEAVGSKLTR